MHASIQMMKKAHRAVTSITSETARICAETIQYCLRMGGEHVEPQHMRLLQDCAEINMTAACFVLRDSVKEAAVVALTAEVSELCAASCEKMGEDPQMKACANQCRIAAIECQKHVILVQTLEGDRLRTPGHAGAHPYAGMPGH